MLKFKAVPLDPGFEVCPGEYANAVALSLESFAEGDGGLHITAPAECDHRYFHITLQMILLIDSGMRRGEAWPEHLHNRRRGR